MTLKLNAKGGFFKETMNEDLNLQYRKKSEIVLSDLPEPVMEGYAFGGWTLENQSEPVVFPITVENDMALCALWQETSSVGEVRNLQALYNLKNNTIDVTWESPFVFDVNQTKITLVGKNKNQGSIIESKDNNFVFENIEKNSGDYRVIVQLIDSVGATSEGLHTIVSTDMESLDEVGNVQATVLSDRIDFKWTSPSGEDISYIELSWHEVGGLHLSPLLE